MTPLIPTAPTAPTRFCDAVCRQFFHTAVDRDEHDTHPTPGHCWWCRCALPDTPPVERYFLARANASAAYHWGTSSTAFVVGDLQVVGVKAIILDELFVVGVEADRLDDADDLTEAMSRFASGLHLVDTRIFHDAITAYDAARADVRRRGGPWVAPRPIVARTFASGVTMKARVMDCEGIPTLEVLMNTPSAPDVVWSIRTANPQQVGEIDRLLRRMDVRYATLIGAQLWVELGMPCPPR